MLAKRIPSHFEIAIWTSTEMRNWTRLRFGKHKGKTLLQVIFTDPSYFFWFFDEWVREAAPILSTVQHAIMPIHWYRGIDNIKKPPFQPICTKEYAVNSHATQEFLK